MAAFGVLSRLGRRIAVAEVRAPSLLRFPATARWSSQAPVLAATQGDSNRFARCGFGGLRVAAALGALALGGGALSSTSMPVQCETTIKKAEEKEPPSLLTRCFAEFTGTALIVHGVCGVIGASMYCGSGLNLFQLAVVCGASVMLAVFLTREISGGHLNPAVSATLMVNDDFPKSEFIPYVTAQTAGATLAGAVNYALMSGGILAHELAMKVPRGTCPSTFNGAFGMIPNQLYMGAAAAFLAEILATAILAVMVHTTGDPDGSIPADAGPVLVGVTVTALITIFAPLTGCGLNPARDLGPRLVSYYAGWGAVAWNSWWIYTAGPIVGAVLGGAFYNMYFKKLRTN